MSGKDQTPAAPAEGEVTQSRTDEVDAFLAKVRAAPAPLKAGERGRLIFAMDATMSRQPTWDTACRIQAEMFDETAKIGGLDVQLVYFRGFRECRASRWVADAMQLADLMTQVSCRGGHTQIGKVLKHVHGETEKAKVDAVVYVGDCMEESIDRLCHLAGELSILGVPVFMFQEGRNMIAERAFREIARLTGGAYCRFDAGSAGQLRQLLSAVAVYAAGGRKALADLSSARGGQAALLLEQLK
jgi:hypothetical protein